MYRPGHWHSRQRDGLSPIPTDHRQRPGSDPGPLLRLGACTAFPVILPAGTPGVSRGVKFLVFSVLMGTALAVCRKAKRASAGAEHPLFLLCAFSRKKRQWSRGQSADELKKAAQGKKTKADVGGNLLVPQRYCWLNACCPKRGNQHRNGCRRHQNH